MSYHHTLSEHFPGTVDERVFVAGTSKALRRHGFERDNAIALFTCCRDEISQGLARAIGEHWGESFNGASLGGLPTLGKTGLGAAIGHAPRLGERERYVFYACPHVGVGSAGEPGLCRREGQDEPSTACGALLALLGTLEAGRVDLRFDAQNVEQSLLTARVAERLPWGHVPDLFELTSLVHDLILEELETTIDQVVDSDRADYAVLSGIQIHGPEGNLFQPRVAYTVLSGERQELALEEVAA